MRDAGELVAQPLVLAEEITDLPGTHADIAGGHVGVRPDILEELGHEALAEAHDLRVGLALGSKSLPPLPPPMGRPVRLFLKICSKPRNLMMPSYTEGWNRKPPLQGADGAVELHRKPRFTWMLPWSSSQGTGT